MQDVSIIGARRSYEYLPDQIRLTLLSNTHAVQHIQQAFGFDYGAVVQPAETFGPVASTVPPGLAFYYGVVPFPEGQLTPIRFIHIEPTRVVIDVAGPTHVLEEVFRVLMELLITIGEVSGESIAPSPFTVRDQSEVRFRGSFDPRALIPLGAYEAISDSLSLFGAEGLALVPTIIVKPVDSASPYAGDSEAPYKNFVLDVRAGFPPNERIFYSVAPLGTGAHLQLLERIDAALAS
jgi:hypothetical protein